MDFRKKVKYPIELCGVKINGDVGTEFSVKDLDAERCINDISRSIELGIITQIGGDNSSTKNAELDEVKVQLEKANAELDEVKVQLENCDNVDEIVTDINTMSLKDLKIKYPKTEE